MKAREYVSYTGIPVDETDEYLLEASLKTLGGPGSGNFGHAGRPGQVGGSSTTSGGGGAGLELTGVGPDGKPTKYAIWKAKQEAKKAGGETKKSEPRRTLMPIRLKPGEKPPVGYGPDGQPTKYAIWKAKQDAKKEFRPEPITPPAHWAPGSKPTSYGTHGTNKTVNPPKHLADKLNDSMERLRPTPYEKLEIFDGKGKIVATNSGSKHRVNIQGEAFRRMQDPNGDMTVVHNHPAESSLSGADLNIARYPGVAAIYAKTTDGSTFSATVKNNPGIKSKNTKLHKIGRTAAGVRSYTREDDFYMTLGHLTNVALHQRGEIVYKYKLGPRMRRAMERDPHVPALKRAFGIVGDAL
jgi:hypothetical protein